MATQVQFRRGTTSQNNAFTGAQGEFTVDTDVWTIRIHDGATAGGKVVPTLTATQTFTNKTMGSNSIWNGNAVGLGYGGTGAALTGVAGAIVYSQGSAFGLSLAGTSGQVLTSGGTSGPTWVNASSLSTGTATTATTATNISGGSAGYLMYQSDTDTTGFIAPGTEGYVLRSAGASTAPIWVTSALTIGSSAVFLGDTLTNIADINKIESNGTSHWTLPVGTTAQRPVTPAVGMVRYNTSQTTFEGYSAGAWSSLGGVTSVDKFTYIVAETSPTAGNGDLDFYAENAAGNAAQQVGQWNRTNLKDYTGTLVGTQTTQNVFNATATTVNAFGAGTSITIGANGSGTTTIRNATTAISGAATVGSTLAVTGNTTLTGDLAVNGGDITTTATSATLFNTNATTVDAFEAATTINIGSASGTTTVQNNLTVTGNLTVNGTTTTLNSTTYEIDDSLIYIAAGNVGNSADIGVVGHFNNGTYQHTGIVRDATDGVWKLFSGVADEPSGSTLDFTAAVYDALRIGALTATTGSFSSTLGVTGNTTLSGTLAVTGATTLSSALTYGGVALSNSVTGTGSMVLSTSPTLTTPTIGVATATSVNKVAITAPATSATLTLANGSTLATAGAFSTTLTATATTALTLPTTGTLATLAGSESLSNKTITSSSFSGTTGAFSGQITSTVATGTAPLVIASTTKVANLNVEQVDGYHADTANTLSTLVTRDASKFIYTSDHIFSGSTSGTTTLKASAAAGTTTITMPAVTGTMVTTGDTGTVTNTMLAGSIANAKLVNSAVTIGTTAISLGASSTTLAGLTSVTSTSFVGALTGNASTATTLQTARAIQGVNFDGSAAITVVTAGTGVSVSGTQVSIGQAVATSSNVQFNSVGVGTAGSGTAGEIRATNAITSYYSDDRLKTRTGNIQNALEKVLSLDGFHYHANETAVALGYDGSKEEVGLSAQQVQAVLPEVIAPAPIDPQYMTLHYERLVPLLVEAIKEQQKQIEELKAKLG